MKFQGRAYVKESEFADCPDAYLCIDAEDQKDIVLRLSSKSEMAGLETLAAALNAWADKRDEKRYAVPKEMLKAVTLAVSGEPAHEAWSTATCAKALEVALHWLSKNPIVPTTEQTAELWDSGKFDWNNMSPDILDRVLIEWQRRMFLQSGR